ncbi:MAG: EamA family transporter [Kiritimatiellales bacterium]
MSALSRENPSKRVLLTWVTAISPAIWGTTYIVASEILPQDRPLTAAVIRCLPAGLLLVLFSRYLPERTQWSRLIVLSALNIAGFQSLLFVAAYRLPGGVAAVIGAIQPLLVMAVAWAVLGQRPVRLSALAGAASIVGMGLLLLPNAVGLSAGMTWDKTGLVAAFAGAVCMAVGTYLSKTWSASAEPNTRPIPLTAFTGWQLTLGGLMLLPLAGWMEPALPSLTAVQMFGYAYLTLIGTLLTYVLWFNGIRRLSPVAVSALGLLSPLTAFLLGWFILGQQIQGISLAGLVLVVASVLVVQWAQARQEQLS